MRSSHSFKLKHTLTCGPPYQVWLHTVQQLRSYCPDQHSLEFLTSALTLTTTEESIFSQDNPAKDDVANQVQLQKNQQFRRHIRKSYNDSTILHCDFDLEDSKAVFGGKKIWLIMMHHQTKFGCKWFSKSEDIILTNIH